jgi:hypothetical protein
MLSRAQCRELVEARLGPDRRVLEERTMTFPWGWVFFTGTPRFVETRRFEEIVLGEGPLLVDRHDGHIEPTGSGLPPLVWAERFERRRGYRPFWRRWGTLAGCRCVTLPFAFELGEARAGFLDSLERVEQGEWMYLYRCPRCRVLYCVEAPVGRGEQFVVRVDDAEGFVEAATQRAKLHLLESRGGQGDGECTAEGCRRTRVRGVMLCIDHLHETGART